MIIKSNLIRTGNGSMNIKMKIRQGDINISYKRIIRRSGSPPDHLPPRLPCGAGQKNAQLKHY